MFTFRITHEESGGRARVGVLTTGRSEVATPAFMPVGSLGNVRSVDGEELLKMGYGLILNNAYHLYLRPGHKVVEELGGVHGFTAWPGAILTDSGGFQVFSLAKFCKVSDEGVMFQSHIDGSSRFISPETSIEIQEALGADIIMAFDHVVALPSSLDQVRDASKRTSLWARRCVSAKRRTDQSLFGIVQGGLDAGLRVESARDLVSVGFDGYAVGGLSVGEDKADMYGMLDVTVPELPSAKPRYLMGVGMPEDLVEGVARGIDMFDCVVPSRHGRTGWLFTSFGRVVIKQARYARDEQPIDPACRCPVCTRYTRAYLHHLFGVKEMLGARLNTIHNLWFFAKLMEEIRSAVRGGTFQEFRREFHRTYVVDRPTGDGRSDIQNVDVS
ncbi:MAG: tRNA guanosine(34) transglycosylase Tgt [Nitrospira sp.]|jgi:queuine tRNA-ribosyltransferase|nr:tRNA guanosine(34) transglycosylase Tgt [Nitrospira sp.]MCI1280244.1 tRNA guanosine(34) transglycosylase Tgt [Nitrospira sp.]HQY57974.1 tRNA guanosine(34) transglycosylase Tgt [Nitrospira sp.]HRA97923.1 tRNA guanosine(34) transglycosylase Tgt [Nitrospira sp.]